jgi:hypothetical protein
LVSVVSREASGVIGLKPEQRGVYIDIINIILDRGYCTEDYEYLAHACNCHRRRLIRIVAELIHAGKLSRVDGNLRQARAEIEREESRNFSETQSKRAQKRWAKTRDNKDLADAIPGTAISGTAGTLNRNPRGLTLTTPKHVRNLPPELSDSNHLGHALTTTVERKEESPEPTRSAGDSFADSESQKEPPARPRDGDGSAAVKRRPPPPTAPPDDNPDDIPFEKPST